MNTLACAGITTPRDKSSIILERDGCCPELNGTGPSRCGPTRNGSFGQGNPLSMKFSAICTLDGFSIRVKASRSRTRKGS